MLKIVLEKGKNLEDHIYCNKEIEIICKGDNIIKNCIFSNILNDKFIIIEGKIKLESNQFLEMKHEIIFKFFFFKNITFFSNLFLKCHITLILNVNNIIFHKNRIENCSGYINFNSINNHFVNNEIVNNKNFEIHLLKEKNFLCFNFFDYKLIKNSKAIVVNSNNNIIKGNQFLNTEYPIIINKNNNNIFDNDFFNSKCIFTCDLEDGIILDLNIENNNFIKYKKKFNKKKYYNIVNFKNNVEDEELMKQVIDIKNIDKEMNKIKDQRLIRKIKKEEKKQDFINDLNKNEMKKMLQIDKKLNEILKLSENLKIFVEKSNKQLRC